MVAAIPARDSVFATARPILPAPMMPMLMVGFLICAMARLSVRREARRAAASGRSAHCALSSGAHAGRLAEKLQLPCERSAGGARVGQNRFGKRLRGILARPVA